MSISFVDLVESVLLLESNYADIAAALADTTSWLYAVKEKLKNSDIGDTNTFAKDFEQAFTYTVQARRFSKNSVDEDFITLQDLIYSLYWNDDINTKSNDKFPLITPPGVIKKDDFLNNTQAQYITPNSAAYSIITTWTSDAKKLTPADDYAFFNPPVGKAYKDSKRERDVLQQAAYEAYKSKFILPALYEIINKRVSVTRKIKSGINIKKIYSGSYNGLVKSLFIETDKYATGVNDGINVFKKSYNPFSAIKYLLVRFQSTNYIKNLEEEVDGIYVKELLTLAVLSKQVFDEFIFNTLTKIEAPLTLKSAKPSDSNTQDPYISFIETGDLQGTEYEVTVQDKSNAQITSTRNLTGSIPLLTIENIERLNTSTSKQFIEAFKALCLHINKKEGQGKEQLSNMLGGLNQAAGVKL
jgi:hypothetical protein